MYKAIIGVWVIAFLGSRIEITEPVNYEKDMLEQYVVVDPQMKK